MTRGERLVFAMNGGIFMKDRRSLGLSVENGKRQRPQIVAKSGPMLQIDGQINPLFATHSRARLISNGVRTTPSRRLWLSISRVPVTFRELAEHQQRLGCRQGLYMDGAISGAFSAEASLAPGTPPFGPLPSGLPRSMAGESAAHPQSP